MKMLENAVMSLIILIVAFIIIYAAVYGPFKILAEKQCLEAGYPHTAITYDFGVYCSTLDGGVTIKIEKIGE